GADVMRGIVVDHGLLWAGQHATGRLLARGELPPTLEAGKCVRIVGRRRRSINGYKELTMRQALPYLQASDFPAIRRRAPTTLQVNLGYLCNLSCTHCHVAAGPRRTELMDRDTMDTVLDFLRACGLENLDVTGGSPEMN